MDQKWQSKIHFAIAKIEVAKSVFPQEERNEQIGFTKLLHLLWFTRMRKVPKTITLETTYISHIF
jgi:hypothetical protein